MKRLSLYISLFTIAILGATLSPVVLANDSPIEVTADEALEWDRANFKFTARGNAIIKQGNSHITAPTIIAHYSDTDDGIVINSITASPNAVLKQPTETLTAKSITAHFKNAVLDEVKADDNVTLTTSKNEIIKGKNAIYNANKRIITITNNVTIEQGKNILTGHKAVFDLKTNKSQITSNPNINNGRVKAVFFGKKKNNKGE